MAASKKYKIKMTLSMKIGLKTYKTNLEANGDYLKELYDDEFDDNKFSKANVELLENLLSDCAYTLDDGMNERVKGAFETYVMKRAPAKRARRYKAR